MDLVLFLHHEPHAAIWGASINDVTHFLRFLNPPMSLLPILLNGLMEQHQLLADPPLPLKWVSSFMDGPMMGFVWNFKIICYGLLAYTIIQRDDFLLKVFNWKTWENCSNLTLRHQDFFARSSGDPGSFGNELNVCTTKWTKTDLKHDLLEVLIVETKINVLQFGDFFGN